VIHVQRFFLGRLCLDRKEEEKAKHYWSKLVSTLSSRSESDSWGHYMLGYLYQHGHGVDLDLDEAFRLYTLGAELGHAAAQHALAVSYINGQGVTKNPELGLLKWEKLASAQGYAVAQFNLGRWLAHPPPNSGKFEKDEKEAVKLYQMAAAQGLSDAQNNLALCLQSGRGIAKDTVEAVRFYKLSAAQGAASAEYNLGLCYEEGIGVNQDLVEAEKWFRAAATQQHEKAKEALVRLEGRKKSLLGRLVRKTISTLKPLS